MRGLVKIESGRKREFPRIELMVDAVRTESADAVLAAVDETDEAIIRRDFCIVAGPDKRVSRVIEKPRVPSSLTRGIGMYLFGPVVFDAVRRTPRTAMRNEYEITDTIQIMIDDGRRVVVRHPVQDHVNLTSPIDILDLNLQLLNERSMGSFIDPSAKVDSTARIVRSVVGRGAVVEAGAQIDSSVVFPGARVPAGAIVNRGIVTRYGIEKTG